LLPAIVNDTIVTLKVIYEIYKKIENDEFVELHKLILSDLDADSLDYVIRCLVLFHYKLLTNKPLTNEPIHHRHRRGG
jgi:hypothetical protein